MPGHRPNGVPTTLLQFLATLQERDQTSYAYPFLNDDKERELNALLTQYRETGTSTQLNNRARLLLSQLRELDHTTPFLSDPERLRLDELLEEPEVTTRTQSQPSLSRSKGWRPRGPRPKRLAIAITVIAVLGVTAIGAVVVESLNAPHSTPPVVAQPIAPVPNQPLVQTDLEQTLSLFGPWETISPSDTVPNTAQPAVLVLKENGSILSSTKWTVPTIGNHSWSPDNLNVVTNLSVNGTHIDLTEADQSFVVGVGQPFIVEQNPGRLYFVNQAGDTWSIPLAQAVALHQPLSHS